MNKTLRNKALRDASRLIQADFNGETWCAPDGYFATAYPIYEGYRVKKDQTVPDGKPDLARILTKPDYTRARVTLSDIEGDYVNVTSKGIDTIFTINKTYYKFLKSIYPESDVYIASDGDKYAPVELKSDGVLVAVIMPIKR